MAIAICVAAYLLGCINVGYYVVRIRTGDDLRVTGSGNAGARNAGRRLGRLWGAGILAADALKGVIVAYLAVRFGMSPIVAWFAGLAVIAGHVLPAQLGFRGGKGAATALGVMLVLATPVALIALLTAFVLALATRRQLPSGLTAIALMPAFAFALSRPLEDIAGSAAVSVVLLVTHRDNLRAMTALLRRRSPSPEGSAS
jgi:glycerol-3-phosphate acyltransferase PlsY